MVAVPEENEAADSGGDSELKQIQLKCNQMADETLESTRRMRQLCEESKEAGIQTLVALDDQGEKLEKIEDDMDQINADMIEAEKALAGMGQCCGLCGCISNKVAEIKENISKRAKENEDGQVVNSQPQRVMDDPMAPQSGYIAKITNDAREDEMEENVLQVNTMVGNLRNMAIDMGSEIESQNRQLERIKLKAQDNQTRIDQANQNASKLLKD